MNNIQFLGVVTKDGSGTDDLFALLSMFIWIIPVIGILIFLIVIKTNVSKKDRYARKNQQYQCESGFLFCTNCGARNAGSAKFCQVCGNGISQTGPRPVRSAAGGLKYTTSAQDNLYRIVLIISSVLGGSAVFLPLLNKSIWGNKASLTIIGIFNERFIPDKAKILCATIIICLAGTVICSFAPNAPAMFSALRMVLAATALGLLIFLLIEASKDFDIGIGAILIGLSMVIYLIFAFFEEKRIKENSM